MATISQKTAARNEAALKQKDTTIWWWAAAGTFFTALEAWIFWQWYASGDMKRVDPGVTPIPGWMDAAQFANTVIWGIGILWVLWFIVLKPRIKTGQLSFDGLFVLAFLTMVWQDSLINYNSLAFTYSSSLFNLGSWSCHIPGWQSPGGCLLSNPIVWDLSFYIVLMSGGVMIGSRFMQSMKAKNPSMKTGQLFAIFFMGCAIGDLLIELLWVSIGMYHYGGTANNMSLFADTRFKLPLPEGIMVGMVMSSMTALYHFRNDKGETWVERGLSQVRVSTAGKQWLRFFALGGALNVFFFCFYIMWCMLFMTQGDAWPKAIQEISWYTNGICGEGTPYTCGGKNIAIPRRDAMNIGPNGEVTMPPGTVPPKLIPHKTSWE